MKILETKTVSGGMGGDHPEYQVRELAKDEKKPANAEQVPDATALTNGWVAVRPTIPDA